jgi:uncharacterized repeat protein (TIGR03987 family)
MPTLILISVAFITLALVLYTVAVWRSWRARTLVPATIVIFWCALAADTLATRMMAMRAETIRWDLHTISGYGALALMALLTVYGTAALVQRRQSWLTAFPKYALPVWVIWVISWITGVVLGIQRVSGGA